MIKLLMLLLLTAVLTGCGTMGVFGPPAPLTAKQVAARNAAAAHPEGGPYTYTWREDVVIDGKEYTKIGNALVVPE